MTPAVAPTRESRAAAAHAAWEDLAVALRLASIRLRDSEGREAVDAPHLRNALARLKADSFPEEFASARWMAEALLLAGRALMTAEVAKVRARIAPAALALAESVEGLLADRKTAETAGWRAMLGEGED